MGISPTHGDKRPKGGSPKELSLVLSLEGQVTGSSYLRKEGWQRFFIRRQNDEKAHM